MTIEERLEKLEEELSRAKRRNRCLLVALVLCFGLSGVAWFFVPRASFAQDPADAPSEVYAHRFVLVDDNSRHRAELTMGTGNLGSSKVSLVLFDEQRKARAELGLDRMGPQLSLSDENGATRASLNSYPGVGAFLSLGDKKGNERTTLWSEEDCSRLVLRDEKKQARALLVADKDGVTFSLCDENDKTRVHQSVDRDGVFSRMLDENGEIRTSQAVHKEGASINLRDEKSQPRATLNVSEDGPHLYLFDQKGAIRAMQRVNQEGPALNLCDESGKIRAILGACTLRAPDGKGLVYPESSLLLFGADGQVRWQTP